MTYKVYLTIELPAEHVSSDAAKDAAVKALQDALSPHAPLLSGRAVEARVFSGSILTVGARHVFCVDIHDGAI